MLGFFKNYLFNRHYRKLLAERKSHLKNEINTFSSVTIIGSSEHHHSSTLREASLFFKNLGIDCHVFMTVHGQHEGADFDINYITREDCLWYGVPSQELLIKWLAHKTDLLISLFPQETPLLKYLVASSNSRLKSGVKNGDMIDPSLDFAVIAKEATTLTPLEQCEKIFTLISSIGIKPPVIELG